MILVCAYQRFKQWLKGSGQIGPRGPVGLAQVSAPKGDSWALGTNCPRPNLPRTWLNMIGRKLAVLSLNTKKTLWVPCSPPIIWRKIPKIGGVRTPRTLAFWMYGYHIVVAIEKMAPIFWYHLSQFEGRQTKIKSCLNFKANFPINCSKSKKFFLTSFPSPCHALRPDILLT